MDRLTKFVEEKIAPPLIKFSQLKYVQVMQRTGLGIMSLLVIGSIFLLIASFPYQPWLDFLGDFRWTIAAASGIGTSFIAVFTVITTSYGLIEYYNMNNKENLDMLNPIILSVASFMLLNPAETVTTVVEGVTEPGSFTGVPTTYMGALGVFSAIIIGIVTVEMYRFFINRKITIKMPEGVPPMVSQAFASLIPSAIVVTFWWLIGHVAGINLSKAIADLLAPLVQVGDSPIFVVLATLLNRILWSVGIHGSNIVNSVGGAFWGHMSQVNLELAQAGEPLKYMYSSVFMDNYIWIGLFPLALALILSKSPRLKALGWLAAPAALFNIGEPLIFGLPIMLNPLMMIPFIISYVLLAIVAIVLVNLGWITVPALTISWITPAPLKTFLATNGSFSSTLFVLISWVAMFFIFYPFVKMMEKQDAEEAEAAQQAEVAAE